MKHIVNCTERRTIRIDKEWFKENKDGRIKAYMAPENLYELRIKVK